MGLLQFFIEFLDRDGDDGQCHKRHDDDVVMALLKNVEEGTVFKKAEETVWQCRNCGYIYVGTEAPEVCPACLHPQAYFEVKKNNY